MVLKDSVFENMSYADFSAPLATKVQGSWNLHSLLPSDLDFFIMFSSLAGIIGSGGQANYDACNTHQDALAHYRMRLGQKGVSLDLGAMLSEGYVAHAPEIMERLARVEGIQPSEAFRRPTASRNDSKINAMSAYSK
ncbi:KR-domain-containing protein [Mytilinidion resinicola]|uniref:KR-domain-containing protein n=1 Tax=Mytilinidion resinicola TaxID=574789 RepID=A0A6A6Y4M8_9PEZI|nr:KR-domain-containing protein [Mytilinidion resinicola]KAF2802984.1 KR-domain-containing protein [Mytilinidion resinicola]